MGLVQLWCQALDQAAAEKDALEGLDQYLSKEIDTLNQRSIELSSCQEQLSVCNACMAKAIERIGEYQEEVSP